MESFDTPEKAVLAIEQGSVRAWTRYPAVPGYFYAGLGAALGVVAIMGPLGEIHPALGIVAALGAAVGVGAIVGAYRRERGQFPLRAMPHELRRPMVIAFAVYLLSYGALLALSSTSIWVASPVIGALGAHLGGAIYERRYREAAERAEHRVGLR